MAGIGITTGIDTDVYASLNPTSTEIPSTLSYANLTAATALAGKSAAKLGTVSEVGEISKDANIIRYGVYGEDSDRSISGQSSLGDFEMSVILDRGNALAKSLADAAVGTDIAVALLTADSTNGTLDLIRGEVAGVVLSRPLDAPAMVSLTIALTHAPASYDKA